MEAAETAVTAADATTAVRASSTASKSARNRALSRRERFRKDKSLLLLKLKARALSSLAKAAKTIVGAGVVDAVVRAEARARTGDPAMARLRRVATVPHFRLTTLPSVCSRAR